MRKVAKRASEKKPVPKGKAIAQKNLKKVKQEGLKSESEDESVRGSTKAPSVAGSVGSSRDSQGSAAAPPCKKEKKCKLFPCRICGLQSKSDDDWFKYDKKGKPL